MKSSIINKLETLQERYEEIQILLGDALIISDQNKFRALSREYSQLTDISCCFLKWRQIQSDLKTAKIMEDDPEMRDMAYEELKSAKIAIKELEKKIQLLLLPKDPDDDCNCFLEIRAGSGGNEAAIFAGDLFRMYSRYSEINSWNIKIINYNAGELGGYKEIISKISGYGVYSNLKFESGGHRVQRVPETESQGRIHTSTCTIAVMPEIEDTKIPKISSNDLKIDTFRSSGAGGQHVNTTDSAIRIVHIPTGISVECQDERSQHKNKAKAMSVLIARIHASEIIKRRKLETETRRNLLGSGDRSNRIRTYHFPQGRITDHRINLTLYRLNEVMEGKLDILIQPILQEYYTDQLSILSNDLKQ
ncbi:Peptide chain release factor 1 [Serratia symbiotica]|nr:Peptide chain release factor 1 [Serratia symbiotica]